MAPSPKLRQRVTWETIDLGRLEIAEETWVQTDEYCLACGHRGVWALDPREAPEDDHRMCTRCGAVFEATNHGTADGIRVTMIRQLQLAEAAAA